jgi:hypothetical protein
MDTEIYKGKLCVDLKFSEVTAIADGITIGDRLNPLDPTAKVEVLRRDLVTEPDKSPEELQKVGAQVLSSCDLRIFVPLPLLRTVTMPVVTVPFHGIDVHDESQGFIQYLQDRIPDGIEINLGS